MSQETPKPARICIIDDNQIAREVITDQLSIEPYELFPLPSGVELLNQFDSIQPDVILMDVMMPRLNGYAICREIKQNPEREHIPIILITALNGREEMLKGLASGADEFLSKPVNGAELRARVRTMLRIKNQYDSLQSILQIREDLAQMLIHDMRNPLTAASLYNNILIKRNQLSPQDAAYAHRVRHSLRTLTGFLDEILTVAKMEHGRLKLSCQQQDMNLLVADVVKNHQEMAQLHGFHLGVDLPAQTQFACVDVSLFNRVLDNLLTNAFKYAPEKSCVTVRLRYPVKAAEQKPIFHIQVIDEGPGIAPEYYERIFDKYEVVKLNQLGQKQVGLGLAFCKMVVEAHHGQIYVSENQPKGTIFNIEV